MSPTATLPSSPCAPRKRRKDARPSELTQAALTLFVERGFAATRLEDVAQRAGVAKGTLYLYFDNKEALFKAVIQEGLLPALCQGTAIVENHRGSAFDLLRQLIHAWWQLIGETPLGGLPKLMIAESRNFPDIARYYYEHVIVPGRALIAHTLELGMANGEFRPMPLDTCIDVIIAPVLMLMIWRHSMEYCQCGQSDPKTYLELQLQLLHKGLLAECKV